MLNFVSPFLFVNALKIVRVTKIAVNIEIRIPQNSTVAKPLIGPVPNCHSTNAAIRVVTFASTIVVNALSYPPSTAARGVFPFFSSSRIRSKMITFASIDIPTVNIKPAIPGKVKVACNEAYMARTNIIFQIKAKSAIVPANL